MVWVLVQEAELVEVQVPKDRKTKMVIDLLAKYVAEVNRPHFLVFVCFPVSRIFWLVVMVDSSHLCLILALQEGHVFEQQVLEKFPPESGRTHSASTFSITAVSSRVLGQPRVWCLGVCCLGLLCVCRAPQLSLREGFTRQHLLQVCSFPYSRPAMGLLHL